MADFHADLHAEFHLTRERSNRLAYGRVKDPNVPLHFHSQIELYAVLEGEVEVFVNDRRRVLRAGEISVAFSYDAHGYRSVRTSEVAYLIVPTDLLHEFLPLFSVPRGGDPFVSDGEVFRRVYDAFREIEGGTDALLVRGYVYVILGTVLGRLPREERSDPADLRLPARVLLYVGEHFGEELSLGDLAAHFGYNPSYLSRLFRETFGVTFGQYLTTVRLRNVILLLRAGEHSVTAAAMESGFGSMRNFYRVFSSEFGCTPKEYLAAARSSHGA